MDYTERVISRIINKHSISSDKLEKAIREIKIKREELIIKEILNNMNEQLKEEKGHTAESRYRFKHVETRGGVDCVTSNNVNNIKENKKSLKRLENISISNDESLLNTITEAA